MRVLRRNGNDLKWQAKLVSEWDADDQLHQNAMRGLAGGIFELAVTRNYYVDRETLLKMYDMHMTYNALPPPNRGEWRDVPVEKS